MPRPCKCRHVNYIPSVRVFRPVGKKCCRLDEVELTVDELEAIRLADLEGYYQEQAAVIMNISRQTFGNIIKSAHKKTAEALVKAKTIKINGGSYQMTEMRKFKCRQCSHQWEIPYGTGRPSKCPACQSENIHRSQVDRGRFGRCGAGCRRGRL